MKPICRRLRNLEQAVRVTTAKDRWWVEFSRRLEQTGEMDFSGMTLEMFDEICDESEGELVEA